MIIIGGHSGSERTVDVHYIHNGEVVKHYCVTGFVSTPQRCSIRFAIRINQDLTMLNISWKIITMNCTIATGLDSVIDKMCLANQHLEN
ncbi:hypothetical protein RIR_jg2989.t1 [Rhizophagus irregularis DAOM 181602=DAOM 197198]|nr:hypothetical protein RIR_jg2989.t1 [Rhizophagus irregularis DAOM 181602=DAOM 197198]